MSIRHLKTLIAIADKGSFIEAADSIFVTQAAVSMQMKTLEEELNVSLFDRTRRPPVLNDAGLSLVPKAREIVKHYEQFMESPAIMDKMSGRLSLGAIPTMISSTLPSALVNLRQSLPQMHVSVSSGLSNSLIAQVDRGAIDAAIISEPPTERPGLIWKPVGIEPLVVIAPIDSTGESPEVLLKNYPFIRYNKMTWGGQFIDQYLKDAGIKVDARMELNSFEAITTMVYHGLGVSIIPQSNLKCPSTLPIRRIPFVTDIPYRTVGVIEKENSSKSHLTSKLIAELSHAMGENRV